MSAAGRGGNVWRNSGERLVKNRTEERTRNMTAGKNYVNVELRLDGYSAETIM